MGKKLGIYKKHKGRYSFIEVTGMDEIAPYIQANDQKPVDDSYINLKDMTELLGPETIEAKEREKLAEKYEKLLKEKIFRGYKLRNRFENPKNEGDNKIQEAEVDEEMEIAKASEQILNILDPNYKTMDKKEDELKHSKNIADQPSIYNPIIHRTAAYVHYTSNKGLEGIKNEGRFNKDSQALFFPDLESAQEYVRKTDQDTAIRAIGAQNAEKAIIFQTIDIPYKGNTTESGKFKVFFDDLDEDSCYTFKKRNVRR